MEILHGINSMIYLLPGIPSQGTDETRRRSPFPYLAAAGEALLKVNHQ
jgi:hypothetical protein